MSPEDISKIIVSPNDSIHNTILKIDGGAIGIAIALDENGRILGTVTDGDVRRAILKGISFEKKVSLIMNKAFTWCHIKDSREHLLKVATEKGILQIPLVDDKGVFVKIETVSELIRDKDKNLTAILMAGGLGSRLYPLTKDTPKSMLEIGSVPILETIIKNFKQFDVNKFVICTNYLSEKIIDYFKDGEKLGVSIEYLKEEKPLGTAGALSLLKKKPQKSFFVMNADILTNVNFKQFLEYHKDHNSIATMCVNQYEFEVPYGVIKAENHIITSIKEKPVEAFFINAGIYLLEPSVLDLIPYNEYFDMPKLFETLLANNLKPNIFPIREKWIDIGQEADLNRAQVQFKNIFNA